MFIDFQFSEKIKEKKPKIIKGWGGHVYTHVCLMTLFLRNTIINCKTP